MCNSIVIYIHVTMQISNRRGRYRGGRLLTGQVAAQTLRVQLRACHPCRVNLKAGSKYSLQLAAHRIMPRRSFVSPAFDMQLLCVGLLMAWVVASEHINCKPVLVIHFFHSVLCAVWLSGYRLCGLQLVCGFGRGLRGSDLGPQLRRPWSLPLSALNILSISIKHL